MNQETETYSAGTSLGDFLDDTLSGANHVSEGFPEPPTDSTSTDAAGAPPAEPSSESRENPTSPEGAPAIASPETPTTGTTSEPPPAVPSESNPFDAASPLTYMVNGQQRTFDGIAYVPGVGAVIHDADVPKLQQRLNERDNLFEKSQQQYQQLQDLERLSAWTTKASDGTDQTLTGRAGLEAQRVLLGSALASIDTLTQAFKGSPLDYLTQDEHGRIIWNQQAIDNLATKAELAEMRAATAVQRQFQTISQTARQDTTLQQHREQAPTLLWQQAESVWGKEFPSLTAQDKQALHLQMPRYIRDATPQEVAAGAFQRGELVLDAAFKGVMQDRAALRDELAKTVNTASTAAAENAHKLRAALLPNGKAPAAPLTNTRPTTRPNTPPAQSEEDRHALFLNMERVAAGAM